jgi:hypothetical protein
LFDLGRTGFLGALRVHPLLRGFGLASLLHVRLLHLSHHVFHVLRVRETTTTTNLISLHLGRKHGLVQVGTWDGSIITTKHVRENVLGQIRRQMKYLGMEEPSIDLGEAVAASAASAASSKCSALTRGRSDQILSFVARHSGDRDVNLFRQYWMLYEPIESNLVYLCTEAVLPPDSSYSGPPSADPQSCGQLISAVEHPYFLVVSPEDSPAEAAGSVPSIGAYSMVLTSQDHTGYFRTFSIYAANPSPAVAAPAACADSSSTAAASLAPAYDSASYRHALLHFFCHLCAGASNRHETHRYVDGDPGRAYTTQPFVHPIEHIQFSTPVWFGAAFLALEEALTARGDAAIHGWVPRTSTGPMVLLERSFEQKET